MNQHYFNVKTLVTSFALTLALCAASGATAQTRGTMPMSKSGADTMMLSQTTEGNYLVRRYVVKNQDNTDYSIRYKINAAMLSSTLDSNQKQLSELNTFIENLMRDSLMEMRSAVITGYSSPDGPMKFNEELAKKRAWDFRNYVDKKYNFSKMYNVTVNSVAEDWEMCRALVVEMPVPDKEKVLTIIDGKWTPEEKEAALKKLPAAWNYMKANILPPLRRVELEIHYGAGNIVETRTMIAPPAPKPEPKPAEPCCEVVDESITGIIVEMPGGHDFEKMTREERREMRAAQKLADKEARIAQKLAKREVKDATKLAKQNVRMAEKMAKAEAKAAAKSAKALEKGMK